MGFYLATATQFNIHKNIQHSLNIMFLLWPSMLFNFSYATKLVS